MTDSRIMPKEERQTLIHMLHEIDPKANYPKTLEEETMDAYDTTTKRIKALKNEEHAKRLTQEIIKSNIH
jgi:hypothetical protein